MGKQSPKEKMVEGAVAGIRKAFGPAAILLLGDESALEVVGAIPTGSIGLDVATGIGGYPRGRIVEVFGPESGGKTTMALHAIAQAQRLGGIAAFVDAEHALDVHYAAALGVNVGKLYLSQPDSGEQALEIVESLVRSAGVDIVVVDSVAALTPKAEIEGEMGDSHMGLQARLMSQALRKLTAVVHRSGTCLLFINQLRQKIGIMFGNPETTTGGNALRFYSSMRLDVRSTGKVKDGEKIVANCTRVKVAKNKLARPFVEAEFQIRFGKGIDADGELIELGDECGVVEKSGAWYAFKGERIGQGKANAAAFLREHAEVRDAVEKAVREKLPGVKREIKPSSDKTDAEFAAIAPEDGGPAT
jgi:recombination protein RecA